MRDDNSLLHYAMLNALERGECQLELGHER